MLLWRISTRRRKPGWSGDNPIFPFLAPRLGFHRTEQKHEYHLLSPPLFIQLSPPLSQLGSTCLQNRDRMQIPIPTARQSCRQWPCVLAWRRTEEAIHSRNCALPLLLVLRLQTLSSLRHPSLETCSGADADAADIVAYIVLTALSFRDREKERARECYKVLQGTNQRCCGTELLPS